jgi:hypothetical protein
MNILILIFAFILLFLGLFGSIVPGIPGPAASYIGVLIIHFFTQHQFSINILLTLGVIVVAIFVMDYSLQAIGVKKYGGGKVATTGTFLGLFIGFIFPPLGILLGPFIGAFAGAFIEDRKDTSRALRVGLGSFFGFISGSILKLGLSILLLFYSAYQIFFK